MVFQVSKSYLHIPQSYNNIPFCESSELIHHECLLHLSFLHFLCPHLYLNFFLKNLTDLSRSNSLIVLISALLLSYIYIYKLFDVFYVIFISYLKYFLEQERDSVNQATAPMPFYETLSFHLLYLLDSFISLFY